MKFKQIAIAEVAEINPRMPKEFKPKLNEIVSFVPMAAVSEASVAIEKPEDRFYRDVAKGFTSFRRGDILVAKITPCFENGKMAFTHDLPREFGFGSTEFHVFRPKGELHGNYLFQLLRNPLVRKAGEIKMKGAAGQKRVPAEFFSNLQIPLPPLAEQKRIAGILDAADALRAKRRESLAQLDTLLQSTFLDMFGDPVTNPKGWEMTTLPKISKRFTDGPFGSNLKSSHYVEDGVRVIRLQNIGAGEMLDDDLAYISNEHFAKFPRNHCKPGDVIIGTMGDPNLRACIIPKELAGSLNKADCLMLRVDTSMALSSYVCWFLNCPSTVTKALELVRGQTRGRISLGRLKQLEVPLPPINLQHHFGTIVESIEKQKSRLRAHLAELNTLFASLQSRAFNGEL